MANHPRNDPPQRDGDLTQADGNPFPPAQMDGVTYCQVDLRHPFSATPPLAKEWRLYLVRADDTAMYADDPAMAIGPLQQGTVIGIAGDICHWFASADRAAPRGEPGDGWVESALAIDPDGAGPTLIVGRIAQSAMPNLSLLGMIRLNPDEHRQTTLRIGHLTDWIIEESQRHEPGSGDVINRLSEIITIELARVVRLHSVLFGERPRGTAYDPRIWRSIAAISREPEYPWSLVEMAKAAGMSRTAFAARYHATVGMTPMRSLRRLRMHRAAMTLAHSAKQTLAPLAMAAGYSSEAAFCRAFVKEFGHPPKQFSRRSPLQR